MKFDPKELIGKIASALKGKKEKFEVINALAEAGVFKDQCDGAADMLSLAAKAVFI